MTQKQYKRYLITAALPYANGPVHIGHLAGVYIPADIYVRYLRLKGEDVLFVCGSDEHGVPVTIRADREGVSVQAVVDKYHEMIKKSFQEFGIDFSVYSRTSNATHHETAQDFFKKLYGDQIFIEKSTEQFYDPDKDTFLADRYIQGTCPHCSFDRAYGDQCENCGRSLNPDDLLNPHSTLSQKPLVKKMTKHWYLPLDKYQKELESWIQSHQGDWKSNVYGQCMSWISEGLQPRSMTRDQKWGIPVPLENAEGKVLYVWFDAPIGYISASKEYFEAKGQAEEWKKYWQDEESKLVHFIGKDNIVFHCVIFPLMLKLHGDYVLPDNVPANEFMNLEDDKISTSRNWAVWLHEYLEEFPGKQDVLRYVLTANAPETKDSVFTWKDFQTRNNSELADILGNFVRRPIALTHKYYQGKVSRRGALEEEDQALLKDLATYPDKIAQSIETYRFREALSYLMDLARLGNQYMQKTAPWTLYKEDKEGNAERIATILNIGIQIIANLSILAEPFLPHTAQKLKDMLHLGPKSWSESGGLDLMSEGQSIEQASILFEKIEDSSVEEQITKLEASKNMEENIEPEKELEAIKAEIKFDDFSKMDIRVATIINAEKVKKTDKLLNITLDTGVDTRTVLSGIAQHYQAEEIIGKQVCLLANLAPRKMRGIESQGMILMAENAEGKLMFVSPQEMFNNGSVIR